MSIHTVSSRSEAIQNVTTIILIITSYDKIKKRRYKMIVHIFIHQSDSDSSPCSSNSHFVYGKKVLKEKLAMVNIQGQ